MTKRIPGPDPFNNPFSKVKLSEPKKAEPNKPPPPLPRARKEKPVAVDAEAAMFLEAMGEVVPTRQNKKHVASAETVRADPVKVAQEDAESMAQLAELVSGDGPFEVTDSGEGRVPCFDPQVMKRLRTGGFRIQGTIDACSSSPARASTAKRRFPCFETRWSIGSPAAGSRATCSPSARRSPPTAVLARSTCCCAGSTQISRVP